MIGAGLAFAMVPLLRRIHAGDPVGLARALERQASAFNAHPYLSPVAIGALARAEHECQDEVTIERFRTALRAPLGALGDQAIWAGWRPFCAFGAIVAAGAGLPPGIAATAFFLVYNAGHVATRLWGLRIGWRMGVKVGVSLNRSGLRRIAGRMGPVNQALMGAAAVILLAGTPGLPAGPGVFGLAAVAGLGGFFLPGRAGTIAMAGLFASLLAGLL